MKINDNFAKVMKQILLVCGIFYRGRCCPPGRWRHPAPLFCLHRRSADLMSVTSEEPAQLACDSL